jgi:hypothetical protein
MNTELLKTTNMERKLELRYICGYLPHRLKVTDDDGRHIYDLSNISLFQGIFKADICQQINSDFFDEGELYIGDLTPVLRPLSDLYRTITHNGKEIVPIVELAKKLFQNTGWKICEKIKNELSPFVGVERKRDKFLLHFWYDWGQFRIYAPGEKAEMHCEQVQLFDYLHELKIDYRSLINDGLAIDANTLETNPYK